MAIDKDLWAGTAPKVGGSGVDDGDYVCNLVSMELTQSKNDNDMVITTFTVADGNSEGKEIRKRDMLMSEQNIAYFKGYCDVIGFEYPDDPDDLQEAMNEFVQNFHDLVRVKLKTKADGNQNAYVNGIEESNAESLPEEKAPAPAPAAKAKAKVAKPAAKKPSARR